MFQYSLIIPQDIVIIKKNNIIYLKGSKGTDFITIIAFINIYQINNILYLVINKDIKINDQKKQLILKTFYINFINKIKGLSQGYFDVLKLAGIGYKIKIVQEYIIIKIGFSHHVKVLIPKNINIFCSNITHIVFFSFNKAFLYQFITKIKHLKKIDAYKGKGIHFLYTKLKLKEGKKK